MDDRKIWAMIETNMKVLTLFFLNETGSCGVQEEGVRVRVRFRVMVILFLFLSNEIYLFTESD